MGIILWIIFGALVGWLASLAMGTDAQQGALANIVLGVIGAFVGGILANFLGFPGITGFNIYSTVIAIIGAMVVIWAVKLIR